MRIISEIFIVNNIYNPLIKYWRALVVLVLCVFLQILALVFPHVFTYRLGRNIFLATVLIALYFDYLNHLPILSEKLNVRLRSFYEKYFLLILLCAIFFFSIGALNEKLFYNDPATHSILQGLTIGGAMPANDNAGYLLDIQSFLKYGVIQSIAVYRPLATMIAAVFYKCCGEDIITYYYLTTAMLILAIFWLGTVVSRHFNKGLAIIMSFCLCLYFALFQGSFLTEMTGGIIGIIAFTATLDGLFRKNIVVFFMGILLLGLALQLRTGAMFILPIFVFYGAVYFRKQNWVSTKTFMISGALVLLAFFTNPIQLSLLSQKFDVASNIGYFVYQIQTNSTYWTQVEIDNPKRFDGLKPYDQAKLANEIALQRLRPHPGTFIGHYILKLLQAIKNPGLYTFHFIDKYLSGIGCNFTLILFFLTPVLYRRNSRMHVLFWFLILGLIGSILSSPVLEVVKNRSYAASISFNMMIFGVAVANGFLFLKGLYFTSSGLHWDFYCKRKIVWLRFKCSLSQIWKRNEIVQQVPKGVIIYIVIALTILIGPVITDKLRNYKAPQKPLMDSLAVQSEGLFLLSVSDSPHAFFDTQNDFVVTDPLVISKTKLLNNKPIATLPDFPFYMFNAINHFDFMHHRYFSQYLVIPVVLLSSIKMDNISTIVLRGENIIEGRKKIFVTKEICKVTLIN